MTRDGLHGSYSAHDTLTYVLNEAQKAGQKHVSLLSGDWHQVLQATKGKATKFKAPDGEIILIYKGFWFHEAEVDPTDLQESGYLDLTGDEPIVNVANYARRAPGDAQEVNP